MKSSEEENPICDVAVELPAEASTENNGGESARRKVHEGFSDWVSSVKNVNLAAKAKALWRYLNDKQTPVAHKAIIIAALLYCIVPMDLVPDFIPLSGLLDDLAIVVSVLAYVDAKAVTDKGAAVPPGIGTVVMKDGTASGKNIDETAL